MLLHLLLTRLMDWALVGAFLLLGVLYNSLLATITIAGTNSRVHQSSGAVALAGLKARDLVKYTNLLGIPAATGPKLLPVPPGKADTRAAGHKSEEETRYKGITTSATTTNDDDGNGGDDTDNGRAGMLVLAL